MLRNNKHKYDVLPGTARVLFKERTDEISNQVFFLNSFIFIPFNYYIVSHYNVHLLCGGNEYVLDDKKLFEKVNVGELIKVNINVTYSRKNKIKKINITLV